MPPSSLPAITITATTRPTITAIRQATSSRMLPCGRCAVGAAVVGCPIRRVGSSCISLVLRSEYRVEDRVGVLDLEAVSQPRLDLLAAAAGDRHLGGQQAGAGRGCALRRRLDELGRRRRRAATAVERAVRCARPAAARLGARRRRGSPRRELGARASASESTQPLGLVAGSPRPGRSASRSASESEASRSATSRSASACGLVEVAPGLRFGVVDHARPRRARPPRRSPPAARRCSAASGRRRLERLLASHGRDKPRSDSPISPTACSI